MSTTPETPKASPEGREANGRFARGNPGGPGNPYARQVAEFRSRVLHRVKVDDLDAIIDRQVELAKSGDTAAARLILQYTLGRPVESAHPDRLDRDEAEAFTANAMQKDEFSLIEATPVEPVLKAVREMAPFRARQFLVDLKAGLAAQAAAEAGAKATPADGKRPDRPGSAPVSVSHAVAFAEAETLRLVTDPDGGPSQSDRRAANPRH